MGAERVSNVRLRVAREALGLTRLKLSRELEAHARAMGVTFACDPTKVRRWEEWGTTPRDYAQEVLIDFFAQFGYGPADLGLPVPIAQRICTSGAATPTVSEKAVSTGGDPEDDEMKRRQLAAGAAALAGLPVLGALTRTPLPALPRQVSRREIDQVRDYAVTFAALGNTKGGGFARSAVVAELEWCGQLLRLPCPAVLRPELFRSVAQYAMTAGFAMFDTCDHENARTAFRFSVACAEEAGDWGLRAKTYGCMARQAAWIGDADKALLYIDLAMIKAARLTDTERAMLYTGRARATARLGQRQETLSAIGAADDAFSRSKLSEEQPWMRYYDQTQHLGDTAHALVDLEMLGVRTDARSRLEQAVAGYGETCVRARAFSQMKLATLMMRAGDPREAAHVGGQALDATARLRSWRALDVLAELGRHAQRHGGDADVSGLRERIRNATQT